MAINVTKPRRGGGGRKRVHFEKLWMKEPGCREIIQSTWANTMHEDMPNHLPLMTRELAKWHANTVGDLNNRVKVLEIELKRLHAIVSYPGKIEDMVKVQRDLDVALEQIEIYWMQRSRVAWLKEGDKNTKFLHGEATNRKRRNELKGLFGNNGVWKEQIEDVRDIAIN